MHFIVINVAAHDLSLRNLEKPSGEIPCPEEQLIKILSTTLLIVWLQLLWTSWYATELCFLLRLSSFLILETLLQNVLVILLMGTPKIHTLYWRVSFICTAILSMMNLLLNVEASTVFGCLLYHIILFF